MLLTIMIFVILQFTWTFFVSVSMYGKLSEIATNTKMPSEMNVYRGVGNDPRDR